MKKIFLGIDLGTTNTVCCTFDNELDFIRFGIGKKELLHSVLAYENGKITIGEAAKNQAKSEPEKVIKSSKTYIGKENKIWKIQDRVFTPTDVAQHILEEVVKKAKNRYNADHCAAVITVPAYFTSNQYAETKKAAEAAGIEVLEILPEPVAAAIAYGVEEAENQTIFVVDLGGGTYDVTVLKNEGNNFNTIIVDGNRKLGGDDFDEALMEICFRYLRKEKGINLSDFRKSGIEDEHSYNQIISQLKFECEKAKKELSTYEETEIIIPDLKLPGNKVIQFIVKVTREDFEEESKPLLRKIKKITERCYKNAKERGILIDKVILVGGSANIPAVQDMIQEIFNMTPELVNDLFKIIAIGAAIKTTDYKERKGLSPILIKEQGIGVSNILAHSFGIKVENDRYDIIIKKGTTYPCKESKIYTTMCDNQEEIKIELYEGEDEDNIYNNDKYEEYIHDNIECNLARVPQIEITFEFDKDRVLHITSRDLKTNSVLKESINKTRIR